MGWGVLRFDAMSAWRLPLLWAFAVGGASGAALVAGFGGGDASPSRNARASSAARSHDRAVIQTARAQEEPEAPAGPTAGPTAAPTSTTAEPGAETEAAREPDITMEARETAEAEGAPSRSVAEVLLGLEAAYRDVLATAALPPPSRAGEGLSTDEEKRQAGETPSRDVPTTATVTQSAVSSPAERAAPSEVAAEAAPSPVARAPVERRRRPRFYSTHEPESFTAPSPAPAPAPSPPAQTTVHVGTLNTVGAGSLHQGDVYLLQQQLAVLQFYQLLAPPVVQPAPPSRSFFEPRRGAWGRRPPAFPNSITNPDNPWGFDFPPPMLAK